MDVTTTDSMASNFATWIINNAIKGIPPLSGCKSLAQEYLLDKSYADNDDRVSSLINWETAKNFTIGFITGLGGLITLPISISASLGASWILQARICGAIACIYGHSIDEDRVRTLTLLCLIGDCAKEVLKNFGIKIGEKIMQKALAKIPGKILIEINKQVGFRLITKAGEKGLINISKTIPLVAAPVSGAFDAYTCRIVGNTARSMFKR